ncbi:ABC transporter ATP-binding protein [Leucobacter sp. cx-328]|uniref:ABC transporter ATP-binding protein n=1 Tax=unclassified Leucobacter TaxID=2621730 RepID=UPI00165E613A|nr:MULTISPECIES: ABC transporter ATP-binding protein [unclassified Leucobacter]MBC9943500.1 ABC transporter ATP-binding protein [Leucobacter sp. cx-328]
MTKSNDPKQSQSHEPLRKDRMRPVELLVFSGVLAIFAGLVVVFTTRDIRLALIFMLVAFIVSVMGVALLGLGGKRSQEDEEARQVLQKPNTDDAH